MHASSSMHGICLYTCAVVANCSETTTTTPSLQNTRHPLTHFLLIRAAQTDKCFNCGGDNHKSRDCPQPYLGRGGGFKADQIRLVNRPKHVTNGGACFVCGDEGHLAGDCTKREGLDARFQGFLKRRLKKGSCNATAAAALIGDLGLCLEVAAVACLCQIMDRDGSMGDCDAKMLDALAHINARATHANQSSSVVVPAQLAVEGDPRRVVRAFAAKLKVALSQGDDNSDVAAAAKWIGSNGAAAKKCRNLFALASALAAALQWSSKRSRTVTTSLLARGAIKNVKVAPDGKFVL
jgi:hypothetical protein